MLQWTCAVSYRAKEDNMRGPRMLAATSARRGASKYSGCCWPPNFLQDCCHQAFATSLVWWILEICSRPAQGCLAQRDWTMYVRSGLRILQPSTCVYRATAHRRLFQLIFSSLRVSSRHWSRRNRRAESIDKFWWGSRWNIYVDPFAIGSIWIGCLLCECLRVREKAGKAYEQMAAMKAQFPMLYCLWPLLIWSDKTLHWNSSGVHALF